MSAADIKSIIIGTGIDVVEIARVEYIMKKWPEKFKEKIFHPDEIAYCDSKAHPFQHYAARLAAKEAVGKAFGTGLGAYINWKDIVIEHGKMGEPSVRLSPRGKKLATEKGVSKILISISHTNSFALAHVILIGEI